MIKSAMLAFALVSDLKPRRRIPAAPATAAIMSESESPKATSSSQQFVAAKNGPLAASLFPSSTVAHKAVLSTNAQHSITTAQLRLANRADKAWVAIRGKVYDLTTFWQKHPGGQSIILAAVGRDCTMVFETSHTELAVKMLAKYQIGVLVDNELPTFPPRGEFGTEINKRVKQYFLDTQQDPKFAPWIFPRYAFILVSFLLCYYLQFFNAYVKQNGQVLAVVVTLFGFALASVNIHFVHDACHGSVTHNPRIWNAMAGCHDFLNGCSSVNWFYQHVLGHHVYTNIDGADPDIAVKNSDFRRIRPWKYLRVYSRQYIYAPILYCFLIMKTRVQDYTLVYLLKSNGSIRINDFTASQHAMFWGGKAFFLFHRVVVPLVLADLSWKATILQLLWADFVQSWSLALTFQANHVVSEVEWPLPNVQGVMEMDWAQLQIETAQEYAHGSWLVSLLTGGLNYQIVHHLFPHHSQHHYAAMAPIIMEVCREYGVTYRVKRTYWEAVGGHIGLLHYLASGEAAFGHPAREDDDGANRLHSEPA